jgi:hypothetical protein
LRGSDLRTQGRPLRALGRQGDVGTVGLIAQTPADYPDLLRSLAPQMQASSMATWEVRKEERFPMHSMQAPVVVVQGGPGGGQAARQG